MLTSSIIRLADITYHTSDALRGLSHCSGNLVKDILMKVYRKTQAEKQLSSVFQESKSHKRNGKTEELSQTG